MAESVKSLPQEVLDLIDVRLWNVKEMKGILRKSELGAPAIPGIAIDNDMVFISVIPTQEELIQAIMKKMSR